MLKLASIFDICHYGIYYVQVGVYTWTIYIQNLSSRCNDCFPCAVPVSTFPSSINILKRNGYWDGSESLNRHAIVCFKYFTKYPISYSLLTRCWKHSDWVVGITSLLLRAVQIFMTDSTNRIWWKWCYVLPRLGHKTGTDFIFTLLGCLLLEPSRLL